MAKVGIDFEGKDNVSPALKTVTARLHELNTAMAETKAKGGEMTALDARNFNKMTSEANALKRALGDVNTELGDAGGQGTTGKLAKLGNLAATAAGALGLGALVVTAGKALITLGQMGEESAQMEQRFVALVGGERQATDQMNAFNEAVGNWLTRDEKMAASTRIMTLGLADSATEAANLAKVAITLGDNTQSASDRIDKFTQMLTTGTTKGLTDFGISVIDVRERIKELTAADESLTTAQATQMAIMEAATAKMQLMGDTMPVTRTQEMENAVADLKDSLADLTAEPYVITVQYITQGIQNLQGMLNTTSNDPTQQLAGYQQKLANAKKELEAAQSKTGSGILGGMFNQQSSPEELAEYQKIVDDLQAKVDRLKTATAESSDGGLAVATRQLDAQKQAADEAERLAQALEDQVGATTQLSELQAAGPEDVAKKIGTSSDVADALLGNKADSKGRKPSESAAENAINALASAIGKAVKGKDFVGQMIGYGETIFGFVEDGMVTQAKQSGALAAAIDALVLSSLAKYGGSGGVGNTSKANGAPNL